ncbi:MAG: P-type conjugative transfer ATPase TrbB [Alphaproteobacteria bacterium]|nr:P-type conjugative transfer ATPase TrbB [Alphaproteobacteria bacterium]
MSPAPDPARGLAMLATALGPALAAMLEAADTIEVMVNPDGRVWVERLGQGREATDVRLEPAETERAIRLVATLTGAEATRLKPIVSAELPPRGERFEGVLPPVARAPCFAIRKPAGRVIHLDEYVASGIVTPRQALDLREAIHARANIIVAGGTGSGKTTLANALLAEIATLNERVVILEDTRELQCAAEDVVALRTQTGSVSLAELVRSTLRLRPDRIIVGEVRGAEALDLLKAWNTGHPGGIATLHANSARAALSRLEQLAMEGCDSPPTALIAEAIDIIVFIERGGPAGRRISEIYAPRLAKPGLRETAAPGTGAHRSMTGATT